MLELSEVFRFGDGDPSRGQQPKFLFFKAIRF